MRQAVLSVSSEAVADYGFAVFQDAGLRDIEILSCEGARGVSRIHLTEEPDEQRLNEIDTIRWWEQVATDGAEYVYLLEMDVTDQLAREGVDADEMPRGEWVNVDEHEFSFEQAGTQDTLSEAIADLEDAGFDITLKRLRDYHYQETPLDALTERQREVLELAYELGYYDVPRDSSTEEIAAEFGIDGSTVVEHLQRAEHNLLSTLLS
ncbi:Bacterio-opsin activator HTH domain-containing protein [Halosimplex carlsbadense 2-9-1]|uniref:Bacterio-opsin activator HTH domain-containing protein n=1 Tax=Halosimplex carlsbadense 2-9-1 TaxID=797114 RepID=M0CFK2_9EURY|nr:helix-turn-helix domain-containing protein [Halosimplex carlsbadense]ELZ21142.1 Bacterio-opsin activator HTH domain-containing protein [Halosimplex carlsbadense 2-9-1]